MAGQDYRYGSTPLYGSPTAGSAQRRQAMRAETLASLLPDAGESPEQIYAVLIIERFR